MSLGYWMINTAGIGGIIAGVVLISLLVTFAGVLRWIHAGRLVEGERHARE